MNRSCTKVSQIGVWAGALLLMASACSGGKVDIGDEASSSSSKLSKFAGSWDGEIELWDAVSGSNRVRIELDAEGQGTVRFGDLPIQSAPDHPYPSDDHPDLHHDSPNPEPLETALYPVREPTLEDGTLEFFVEMGDLFDAFCAAQIDVTPPCDPPDSYSLDEASRNECNVNWEDPDGGPRLEYDVPCPRAYICYLFVMCECSEDTCVARDFQQIHFRMTSEGDEMSADVRFISDPVYHEIDFD